jgi:AcrR family transcriptional regulator
MPSITRRSSGSARRAAADAEIVAVTRRLLSAGMTFTELGIQHIAAEAGVARSTFYAHFKDKTALLMRLASTFVDTSFGIASAWEPAEGPDGMAAAFLEVVGVYREHRVVLQAIAEVAAYDVTVREYWSEVLARFTERTIEVLEREQREGRTPAGVNVTSATRVIVMGGERALFDHVVAGDPSEDEAFAREMALIWWHGAYRRA